MKYLMTVLLCTSLVMSACTKDQPVVMSTPMENIILGIDISHHQGEIDWTKVKSYNQQPIAFIYMKATEGATYKDPMYNEYYQGAQITSIPIGSYHYFRTSSNVTDQYTNFISVVDSFQQDLTPMVDVEECKELTSSDFNDSLNKFISLLEEKFGKKPILYTVNSFYNRHLQDKYMDYPVCIGRYGPEAPNLFDDHSWTLWQYTDKAHIDGIEKAVDIDIMQTAKDTLRLYL